MDNKVYKERYDFVKGVAMQVGVLQYAGNVPQQGPVQRVETESAKIARNESGEFENIHDVDVQNKIRQIFTGLMGDIITSKGD